MKQFCKYKFENCVPFPWTVVFEMGSLIWDPSQAKIQVGEDGFLYSL